MNNKQYRDMKTVEVIHELKRVNKVLTILLNLGRDKKRQKVLYGQLKWLKAQLTAEEKELYAEDLAKLHV